MKNGKIKVIARSGSRNLIVSERRTLKSEIDWREINS